MNLERCLKIFSNHSIESYIKTRSTHIELLDEDKESIVCKFTIYFFKSDRERTPTGSPPETVTLEISKELLKDVTSMEEFKEKLIEELNKER